MNKKNIEYLMDTIEELMFGLSETIDRLDLQRTCGFKLHQDKTNTYSCTLCNRKPTSYTRPSGKHYHQHHEAQYI